MRTAFGWLVGLVVTLLVATALTFAGHAIGTPPTSGRNDVDVGVNAFGYVAFSLAFVVGCWAGQAAYWGRWDPSSTAEGRLTFFAWLMGTTLATVTDCVIRRAFRYPQDGWIVGAEFALEIASILGIAWASQQWWRNRVAAIAANAAAAERLQRNYGTQSKE